MQPHALVRFQRLDLRRQLATALLPMLQLCDQLLPGPLPLAHGAPFD